MTRRLSILMTLTATVLAAIVVSSCVSSGSPDLYNSAQAYRAQAEMLESAMTATAQAPIVHITETAAAMQIQAIQAAATGTAAIQTQSGAMTATAVWWTPTPNFSGTQTSAAISAQQTAGANAAIRDYLELERQIQNNEWNRIAGPIGLTAGVGILLVLVVTYLRRTRYQPARVDARGNVLPIIDIVDGMATDLDRNPNHRGAVSAQILIRILSFLMEKKWGMDPLLPEITATRQDAVTERDQMIDLATRGLPGPSSETKELKRQAGQQMIQKTSEQNLANRFKVLGESDGQLGVIDGTIIQVLDQDWAEAKSQ
jgi:hypothetical protein